MASVASPRSSGGGRNKGKKKNFSKGDLVWLKESAVRLANMGEGFPLAGRLLWVSKGRCNVYVCGEGREVLTTPGALERFTPDSLVEGYNFGNHEFRAWRASVSDLLHHVARFRKATFSTIPKHIADIFVQRADPGCDVGKGRAAPGGASGAYHPSAKRLRVSDGRATRLDLTYRNLAQGPRRSRRQAEEKRLCRPTFLSVLGGSSNHRVLGRGNSEEKTSLPRTPARSLCGVEGADAVSNLLEFDMNDEHGWLSGAFMDFVFCIFAKKYRKVVFLPTMFAAHDLQRAHVQNKLKTMELTDVLGNTVDPTAAREMIFTFNVMNRHWNVVRLILSPQPELQLFEPMGKPSRISRADGTSKVSARNLPKRLFNWLESMWPMKNLVASLESIGGTRQLKASGGSQPMPSKPMPKDWPSASISAITAQHQLTSFDCGVACLLYSEKIASGQDRDSVDRWTDQSEITRYRTLLSEMMEKTVLRAPTPKREDS
jgi:hypothetical protein|eukprot:g5894.t1